MTEWYVLAPRHGFFAKDGRGWHAGSSGRARGLPWPMPQTVRGAVCTSIGRALESAAGKVHDAQQWLALKAQTRLTCMLALRAPAAAAAWRPEDRMWPAPADALHLEATDKEPARVARLVWQQPSESPRGLGPNDDAHLDAVRVGFVDTKNKPALGPPWWTDAEFTGWLLGKEAAAPVPPAPRCGRVVEVEEGRQPQGRTDIHVKMDADTGSAEPHMLWANDFRETLVRAHGEGQRSGIHRWGIAVGLALDGRAASVSERMRAATLAGERRLADIEATGQEVASCPGALTAAVGQANPTALRLYVVTPTVFEGGWLPDGFSLEDGQLVGPGPGGVGKVVLWGAMVPRAMPVSGWHLQSSAQGSDGTGPRDLSWAVPPGAVYGIRRADSQPFTAGQVRDLWLARWGDRGDDGFGRVVAGLDQAPPGTNNTSNPMSNAQGATQP